MNKVKICKVGLIFGSVFAIYHMIWATMVFIGWAKPLMDWILKLHFIHFEYAIEPFNFADAALLVLVTGLIGCIFGCVIGCFWNCCCGLCDNNSCKTGVKRK